MGEAASKGRDSVPAPPADTMRRQHGTADLESYERVGRNSRRDILSLLPPGWTFAGKRVLDFASGAGRTVRHFLAEARECELWAMDIDEPSVEWLKTSLAPPLHVERNEAEPPLDVPDGHFDLIWSISLFTLLTDSWARWLLELHRVLAEDGLLIATYAGEAVARTLPEPWREATMGMVASHHDHSFAESSGPAVLHSRWWLQEHWGRAFEILEHRPTGFAGGRQGVLLMRRKAGPFTPGDLERDASPGTTGAVHAEDGPPIPPRELLTRIAHTAQLDRSDEWLHHWFEQMGMQLKKALIDCLPEDYSFEGKEILDFGCGSGRVLRQFIGEARSAEFWGCDLHLPSIAWLQANLSPPLRFYVGGNGPLPHRDASLDLVYGISVFTHITHDWSSRLLELHRILKPDGLLLMTFMGPKVAEMAAGEPVRDDDLGMAVLNLRNSYEDNSGPLVLQSPWWLRARWGRAFEVVRLEPFGFASEKETSHGYFLGRKRDVELSPEDLEWQEPGEVRELRAQRSQVRWLEAEARRSP